MVPPARGGRPDAVLLIESDPYARDLYRTALHDAGGFTVVPARDEIDALRRLDASTPDAVVVNLAATGHHARDLLAGMRLRGEAHIPVIAISDEDPEMLEQAGFACVIATPVDLENLLEEILRCLAERRDHPKLKAAIEGS
jgi:DNA-binding NtrC family response regulator